MGTIDRLCPGGAFAFSMVALVAFADSCAFWVAGVAGGAVVLQLVGAAALTVRLGWLR